MKKRKENNLRNCLAILVLLASSLAQNPNPNPAPPPTNPGAPDVSQGGSHAPFIGNAGQQAPCVSVAYEGKADTNPSDTFFLYKMGPCGWNQDQLAGYRLINAINIQQVSFWLGTSSNTRFETVSNIQVWTPDGLHMIYDWMGEFDKHQDVTGNYNLHWDYPLGITLPAGSIIKVYRYPGGIIFCGRDYWYLDGPSPANVLFGADNGNNKIDPQFTTCATEIHWRFYGNGK